MTVEELLKTKFDNYGDLLRAEDRTARYIAYSDLPMTDSERDWAIKWLIQSVQTIESRGT